MVFRNPDGEDNNSAADDGASLFEEFSDSLTELKMGNKLYQRLVEMRLIYTTFEKAIIV